MELTVNQAQFDTLFEAITKIYIQAELEINNYRVEDKYVYFVPNEELTPRQVLFLSKAGVTFVDYAVFLKIPNANLTNTIPSTISWYEFNGPGTTWGDMTTVEAGTSNTVKIIEPYTNNILADDLNALVNNADVDDVMSNRGLQLELSRAEYPTPLENLTYQWIDTFYNRGVFFDFLDAFYEMRQLFQGEAGANDAAKIATVNANDPEDARIVCKWDLVDVALKATYVTNRLNSTSNMGWFNDVMRAALQFRMDQWKAFYQTLLISNKQVNFWEPEYRTQVGSDGQEYYLQYYLRQPFFGLSNFEPINYNDFIAASGNYNDASFGYSYTKANATTDAKKILENRKYYVV